MMVELIDAYIGQAAWLIPESSLFLGTFWYNFMLDIPIIPPLDAYLTKVKLRHVTFSFHQEFDKGTHASIKI